MIEQKLPPGFDFNDPAHKMEWLIAQCCRSNHVPLRFVVSRAAMASLLARPLFWSLRVIGDARDVLDWFPSSRPDLSNIEPTPMGEARHLSPALIHQMRKHAIERGGFSHYRNIPIIVSDAPDAPDVVVESAPWGQP